MTAKITVVFTRPTAAAGVADLYNVRDRLALQGLDPAKASEYAFSAFNTALNGADSDSTVAKITISIEPADAPADVVFPGVT